jgi:hypothetical protein
MVLFMQRKVILRASVTVLILLSIAIASPALAASSGEEFPYGIGGHISTNTDVTVDGLLDQTVSLKGAFVNGTTKEEFEWARESVITGPALWNSRAVIDQGADVLSWRYQKPDEMITGIMYAPQDTGAISLPDPLFLPIMNNMGFLEGFSRAPPGFSPEPGIAWA